MASKTSKIVTELNKIKNKPKKRDIIEFSDDDEELQPIKEQVKEPIKTMGGGDNRALEHVKTASNEAEPKLSNDAAQLKAQLKESLSEIKSENLTNRDRLILEQIIKQNTQLLESFNLYKAEQETQRQIKEQKKILAIEQNKREKELEKLEIQKLILQRDHELKKNMTQHFNNQLIRTRRGLLG